MLLYCFRMDLTETFEKQKELLGREPWASITRFIDLVNDEHPNTLSAELKSINLVNGTASLAVRNNETNDWIMLETETVVSNDLAKKASPSKPAFLVPDEIDLFFKAFLDSTKRDRSFGSASRPIELITEKLIPDLPLKTTIPEPKYASMQHDAA